MLRSNKIKKSAAPISTRNDKPSAVFPDTFNLFTVSRTYLMRTGVRGEKTASRILSIRVPHASALYGRIYSITLLNALKSNAFPVVLLILFVTMDVAKIGKRGLCAIYIRLGIECL